MQGSTVVKAKLSAAGKDWLMTCVSMGNPHAITYGTADGGDIKVRLVLLVPFLMRDTFMLLPAGFVRHAKGAPMVFRRWMSWIWQP